MSLCLCVCPSKLRQRVGLCVRCVCVYESLSVCVCPCLLLAKVFTVHIVNELARRPPKPLTGGQAVTAQLIVVSIGEKQRARLQEISLKKASWNEAY